MFLTATIDYIIEKEPLVNKFISRPKDKGRCQPFRGGLYSPGKLQPKLGTTISYNGPLPSVRTERLLIDTMKYTLDVLLFIRFFILNIASGLAEILCFAIAT